MDCIELPVEVIVVDDHLTPDQLVAQARLNEGVTPLHLVRPPRPLRSLAEAMQLVNRDLGILDAHVEAYHASEHYIPF